LKIPQARGQLAVVDTYDEELKRLCVWGSDGIRAMQMFLWKLYSDLQKLSRFKGFNSGAVNG
jgi:hypothetical protein